MKLLYDKPSREMFVRSLPMGSGILGAMICPDLKEERIVINHAWMWRHYKTSGMENPEVSHWIPYLRKLYFSDRKKEAGDLANKVLGSQARSRKPFYANDPKAVEHLGLDPTDGIYGPDPFVPVGEIRLQLDEDRGEAFRSELELDTGIAEVAIGSGNRQILQTAFVSRNHDLLAMELSSEVPFSGKIFLTRVEDEDCELQNVSEKGSNMLLMKGTMSEGRTFALEAEMQVENGCGSVCDGVFVFKKITRLVIMAACATDHENENPSSACKCLIQSVRDLSFEEIKEEAVKAHKELYGRVRYELEGNYKEELTTDKRLTLYGQGEDDPGLLALLLQLHRYFVICYSKSGGVPGNLSGIWSDEINPAWCCDIHNDTNSQGMYFVTDNLNLPEPTDVFFEFFERMIPAARDIARKIYGCRGIFIPLTSSCWPECFKVEPGWDEMASCAAWLSEHFWWRYDFFRDEGFLRDHAYPFLREAALFYMDYLVPDPRKDRATYGKLQSFPSYSPENNYIGSNMPVALNASCPYEMELIWELFEHVKQAAEILGKPQEEIDSYQYVLDNLAPIGIDSEGRIMEWDEDYPQETILIHPNDDFGYGHRHISPAIGAFPGDIITREAQPELAEAIYQFLKSRIRYGSGNGGIGGWMGTIFARIGSAEEAQDRMRNYIQHGRYGTKEITRMLSPSGGLFSTFAATQVEMILQSHKGYLELLPNLSDELKSGRIYGLRARGNFSVEMQWEEKVPIKVEITSFSGGPLTVKYGGKKRTVETEKGKTYSFDQALNILA